MGFRWAPAVFAEYTPTYCWISAIVIVMGCESAGHLGVEQQHARLTALTALWGAATLAWLAIHRLERSR
jgi:hypothetical protein